jgi:hypothetical protein
MARQVHRFDRVFAVIEHTSATAAANSNAYAYEADDGSVLVVSGAPISTGAAIAEVLTEACCGHHPESLIQLDGAFTAVYWDASRRRLTVVSDILGLQPSYMAWDGRRLVLASELKAMAAATGTAEMDAAGWGAFVGMGHCLGDTTMLAGVRRIPAASILTWDENGRKLEERRYWKGPEGIRCGKPDTGALVDALEREVRAYAGYCAPGTVLLSGGFDSRLLSCVLLRAGFAPAGLTVRHPGERLDADGRFAEAVAQVLGIRCTSRRAPAGFFNSSEYLDYLEMQEVACPTLGLFIAQVSPFVRPELGAVWEGVAPGYALAFPRIRKPDLKLYLRGRCHTAASPVQAAARLVFARADEMRREFELLLAAEAKECDDGDSGLLRFEARHQMRNRMGHNPLKVYSNHVPCFTPGTSRAFWEMAAAIPYSAKWNFRLYFDIFRNHFPQALATPFCSMGQLWSDRFRSDPYYHLARLFPPPGAQVAAKVLRRAGLGGGTPALIRRVVSMVEPGHADLRRDAVARLQSGGGGEVERQARRLLFHWQIWRWVLEGRLDAMRPAILGGPPE